MTEPGRAKEKAADRAKRIDEQIRAVWSSLQSHLPYAYEKHPDGVRFHKRCIREYAEQILALTELY